MQRRRWLRCGPTATRLLHSHGAVLHAAAPAANSSGMDLAWLLGEHGDVLDVSPDAVGLHRQPDGKLLTYRQRSAMAPAGVVPAWQLIEVPA